MKCVYKSSAEGRSWSNKQEAYVKHEWEVFMTWQLCEIALISSLFFREFVQIIVSKWPFYQIATLAENIL